VIRKPKVIAFLLALFFAAVAAYCWIVPLVRPQGIYGWGHYRLINIYAGTPTVLALICALVFLVSPRDKRISRTLRLATVCLTSLAMVLLLDAGYAIIVKGALRTPTPTDFWFDGNSISADDNLPDPELGFHRKPHLFWQGRVTPEGHFVTYRTDANGFRNDQTIKQADLVFIGDSFTEGASVPLENTFVQLVGKTTNRAVVNLGCGYYGAQQELIVLRRYGLTFNPRVVVWQIFEGNDLSDARRFADWQKNPIRKESLLQRYARYSFVAHLLNITVPKPESPVQLTMRDPNGVTLPVSLDYSYRPDEPEQEPVGWAETIKAIDEGNRLCASHGIKLIVLFVPVKGRILEPYVSFPDPQYKSQFFPRGVADSNKDFGHQLANFCGQIGCSFVDVTEALRSQAAADNRFVYMTGRDSHLNVDGHKVVADRLVKAIESFPPGSNGMLLQPKAPATKRRNDSASAR
jgi:hypothetical protein